MRFRLLTINLGTLFLLLPAVVFPGGTDQILWCPELREVRLADCRTSPPENDQPFLAFPLEKGCLGPAMNWKRTDEEPPKCRAVRVIDEHSQEPVSRACEVVLEKLRPELRVHTNAHEGVIQVPSWIDHFRIRCPGYADLAISPTETRGTIVLRRGRVVKITAIQDHPGSPAGAPQPAGTIEMHHIDETFSTEVEIRPGKAACMGSVPVGEYTMKIRCDGAATVVDSFTVIEAPEPLELAYPMVPGHCVTVPVYCPDFDGTPGIDYELHALSDTKPPLIFEVAALSLDFSGENEWQGQICDVPGGRYELVLIPRGFGQQSRIVEIGDTDLTLGAFQLDRGISSFVDVIDEDGLPVAGALLTMSWRDRGLAQRAEASTNEQGQSELPSLQPNTRFRLHVKSKTYVPTSVDGLAGDRLLVAVKKEGAITAKIIGDICDEEVPGIVVEVERVAGEGSRLESYRPEGCAINIPVARPGTYRLAISAPDVVRHHEEIRLVDDLCVDLGEIELTRGEELSVKVVHKQLPVSGATVRLSRSGPTKVTDSRGVVEFAAVDAESTTAEVFVSHPDFASRRVIESLPDDNELVVEVFRGGEINGRVVAADGSPAVGETVYATSSWDQLSATVDGRGMYRFPRLDPGQWRVFRIRNFGEGQAGLVIGTGDSRFATVREGESVELNFVPRVHVQGRVFVDGRLSSTTTIGAVQVSGSAGSGPSLIHVSVNSLGEYATDLPLPGRWSFWLGQKVVVTDVVNCPCVADLYYSTEEGNP
jgi:hypothetical protein